MILSGVSLSRRTALRGIGATIALPFLDAMLPAGALAQGRKPVRLIAIEGANVRANFNNNIIVVPVTATDVDPDNTVVAAAPMVPTIAPLAPAVPTVPASTPPAMSTAKPSSPSADL